MRSKKKSKVTWRQMKMDNEWVNNEIKIKIKSYLATNENGHITVGNLPAWFQKL